VRFTDLRVIQTNNEDVNSKHWKAKEYGIVDHPEVGILSVQFQIFAGYCFGFNHKQKSKEKEGLRYTICEKSIHLAKH